MTRAFDNNNPGNIRIGAPWVGLLDPTDMTPEQQAETAFCVFATPAFGFRALAKVLLSYYDRYKLRTVSAIISRYAPDNENNTQAYVADICQRLGVIPLQIINCYDAPTLEGLCKSIAIHESGSWLFQTSDLETGVGMALGTILTPSTYPDNGPLVA